MEEGSESRNRSLQRADLRLQGAKRLGEGKQFGGQGWLNCGSGRERLLRESVEMAMMQEGEQFKVLPAHPFFAAIAGMVLKGKVSLRHPAAEGFGINAEATTGVGSASTRCMPTSLTASCPFAHICSTPPLKPARSAPIVMPTN